MDNLRGIYLINLKADTEVMRAMIGKLYYLIDVAQHDPHEEIRKLSEQQVELFTSLVKAYLSDFGYQLTRDAIQILDGVGYCSELPFEQHARDIKILSIWEGTNYIQSLDLVGRKLSVEGRQGVPGLDPERHQVHRGPPRRPRLYAQLQDPVQSSTDGVS